MRHPPPSGERINWRLVALLIAILTLGLAAAITGSGEVRTATALGRELGPGWTCTPKIVGTVCVKDVAKPPAKG